MHTSSLYPCTRIHQLSKMVPRSVSLFYWLSHLTCTSSMEERNKWKSAILTLLRCPDLTSETFSLSTAFFHVPYVRVSSHWYCRVCVLLTRDFFVCELLAEFAKLDVRSSAAVFGLGWESSAVLYRVVSRSLARLCSQMYHSAIRKTHPTNPFNAILCSVSWDRKLENI